MQERLLIAFALIGVVLMGMQYFMPSQTPTPPAEPQKQTAPRSQPNNAEGSKAAATPAAPSKPGAAAVQPVKLASTVIAAAKDQTVEVDTDLYKVVFSNRGAVVHSWVLKRFKDSAGKPLELVNPSANGKTVFPMAVRFHVGQSAEVLNSAPFVMTVTPDRLRGRMSSVYLLVVTSGPRLGDVESGVAAALGGVRVSFVSGGLLTIVGVGLVVLAFPALARFRSEERRVGKECA